MIMDEKYHGKNNDDIIEEFAAETCFQPVLVQSATFHHVACCSKSVIHYTLLL